MQQIMPSAYSCKTPLCQFTIEYLFFLPIRNPPLHHTSLRRIIHTTPHHTTSFQYSVCFNICIHLSRFNRFEDLAFYLIPSLPFSYFNLDYTTQHKSFLLFVSLSNYYVFYSTPPNPQFVQYLCFVCWRSRSSIFVLSSFKPCQPAIRLLLTATSIPPFIPSHNLSF